jgi:TolA-binding protein
VSPRSWPDGDDPIAVELRRAFDEAQLRGPNDVMLRRGWAAIVGRPAWRRPRGWSWFAGGMATTAAVAVACAALLWPRAVETPGARERAMTMVTAPTGESTMTTGPEGRRVTLDGGVEARLEGSSVMRIDRGDARVEEGAVRFSVPQRRPGHPFVVRAQNYRVVVLGTKFGVAVRGDKQVDVDVAEGVVEVWSDVRVARLERGESWHSTPPEAATPVAPAPVVAPEPTLAPAPVVAPEPTLAPVPAEPAPAVARAAVDTHKAARHHASRGSSRAVAAVPAEPAAVRTGPGAENAAYEIGKVLSERGQPASAVAAWRRYRADYPNGILRVEADVSIIETLARAGHTDDALAEATDFLRRRPDSERRGEIARVTGDLYRARGDCRQAVGAYQVALAEAAGFHRAACLVRLGDAAGVDAARAYLRSHPDGRFKKQAAALIEQGVPANH